MRYVIIRDDDTNALTPVDCLERLYRPFLERGLPVNLAAIPNVAVDTCMSDGSPEGYLLVKNGDRAQVEVSATRWSSTPRVPDSYSALGTPERRLEPTQGKRPRTVPLGANPKLVRYLLDNPSYHIVQHGCQHQYMEFDRPARDEVAKLLEQGTEWLQEAGFPHPQTFVAPYDRFSSASLLEVAKRFPVISSGWYELRRLPYTWWPKYAFKKIRHTPHWRVGCTVLLTHPGCLLSYHRAYSTMLGGIIHYLNAQRLTVLVTHWWEYFRGGQPDEPFIEFLHETAAYLAGHPELKVIPFSDLVNGKVPLN